VKQETQYPYEPEIRIAVEPARTTVFTLRLRIPVWAENPALTVNGEAYAMRVERGFAGVTRAWSRGDRVTLTLPARARLEALPANGGIDHANVVALLYGPLVLFVLHTAAMSVPAKVSPPLPYSQPAVPQPEPLVVPRAALLAARRTGQREWTVAAGSKTLRLVPFTEVGDRPYTTYVVAV
jgi:DUF1680 family protein